MGKFSAKGLDLSEPNLDTETVGDWLLCMQVDRKPVMLASFGPHLGGLIHVVLLNGRWNVEVRCRMGWLGVVENHFQVAIG